MYLCKLGIVNFKNRKFNIEHEKNTPIFVTYSFCNERFCSKGTRVYKTGITNG